MTRIAFFFAVSLGLLAGPALAHDYSIGALKIAHPWARATPKGASVGGGYLKITNTGSTSDRFIGGSSDVSARIEIHEMSMANGVMKMRELAKGLEIKPGETIELKPSGNHIMFSGLNHQLKQGDHIAATLQFEKAGKLNVEFYVEGLGAKDADSGGHDMHGMSGAPMKH